MYSKIWLFSAFTFAVIITAVTMPTAGATEFVQGQVWTVKSRAYHTAKVIVGRVAPWNDKIIVHVSVVDIPVPSGYSKNLKVVDHMPFELSALSKSIDELIAINTPAASNFEISYKRWQSDPAAGVFEISVSQAIKILLQSAIRERT
jgi:hypothetical protein